MSKFKIGDKVKISFNDEIKHLRNGFIGTVYNNEHPQGAYFIYDHDNSKGYEHDYNLQLYKEVPKVAVVKNEGWGFE